MDIYIPFGWFYLFNLVFLALFLYGFGVRQRYPLAAWSLLIAWVALFFLIGLKIMNFPMSQWGNMLFKDLEEPVYQKFLPGGVLFFAAGLLLIRLILGFRGAVMSGLILVLPLAIAVQRVGCFINGCCYGTPSGLPWAVSYPEGTSAFVHYADLGLLQPGGAATCPLHPVQLYTAIGALVVLAILLCFRNSFRSLGGRTLLGVILLAAMRFAVEFFRETPTTKWYADGWLGLNYLQWILIAAVLLLAAGLVLMERRAPAIRAERPYREDLLRNSAGLLTLVFLTWNVRHLLEIQEILFAGLLLLMALIFNVSRILTRAIRPAMRYATASLLVIAFAAMGQDVIRTEADTVKGNPDKLWFNIGLGGSTGSYEEIIRDCSGNITERRLKQETAGSLNLGLHHQPSPKNHLEYGMNLWINSDRYVVYKGEDQLYLGATPYFRYDRTVRNREWLSVLLGANFIYSNRTEQDYEPGTQIIPAIYLRMGPRDGFFADIGVGNQIILTGKPDVFQIGFGTGLGKNYPGRNTLRFGVSVGPYDLWDAEDYMHLYVAGDFRLTDAISVQPGFYFMNKAFGTLRLSMDIGR